MTSSIEAPRGRRFADVALVAHDGRAVRLYSDLIHGRVVICNATYTVCNERCPPVTRNLLRVQQLLGAQMGRAVFIRSFSVLPEVDTPAALRDHMALHGVGPGWTFVTGTAPALRRARRSLGLYDPDPVVDADRRRHTGMLVIGNDLLDRWCMAPALADPEQIVEAVLAVHPQGRALHPHRQRPVA